MSKTSSRSSKTRDVRSTPIISSCFSHVDSSSAASSSLLTIVSAAWRTIELHAAQQKAISNVAKQTIHGIMQAVEWQLLPPDPGERLSCRSPCSSAPAPLNDVWTCEAEPPTTQLDAWMRGVIPLFSERSSDKVQSDEKEPSPPVVSSPKHSVSGRHSRGASSGAASRASHTREAPSATDVLGTVREKPQPQPIETVLNKADIDRERHREAELRRYLKRTAEKKEQELARQKDQAEKERLEQIQTELRGKHYTFDSRGHVIMIAPPPDKMPAFSTAPHIVLKDYYLTPEQEAEIEKRKKYARNRGVAPPDASAASPRDNNVAAATTTTSLIGLPHKSPSKSHSKSHAATASSANYDAAAIQPALLQSMTLAKGVTLSQGQLKKSYEEKEKKDMKQMTRSEYLAFIAAQQNNALSASSPPPRSFAHTRPAEAAVSNAAPQNFPASTGAASAAGGGASSAATATSLPHTPAHSSSRSISPDEELTWGAATASFASPPAATNNTVHLPDIAQPASSSSSLMSATRSAVDEFNRALLSDAMWGLQRTAGRPSPPLRPQPDSRERQRSTHRSKSPPTRSKDLMERHLPLDTLRANMPVPPQSSSQHTQHMNSKPFTKIAQPSVVTITPQARQYFKTAT